MRKNTIRCVAASTAAVVMLTALPLSAADSDLKARKKRSSTQDQVSSGELERLNRLVGSQVVTSDNQRVGKLNSLILDLESGRVLFAIVSPSEGQTRVALPPGVFASSSGESLRLNINSDRFRNAPKLEGDLKRESVAQARFVHRIYQAFDQPLWWQGSGSAKEGEFNNVRASGELNGLSVVNVQDKPVGQVRNAVIDMKAGRIAYVVVEPASGMNLGDKLYAFPPSALTSHKNGKQLTVDTDREKMASGPSFDRNEFPRDRSFALRVYQHYGKQPYFNSGDSNLTPTGRDSGDRRGEDSDNWNLGQENDDDDPFID